MKEQLAIQALLQKRFDEIRRKNPSYSVRSFATKVGINSGALSGILNGKRNVSEDLARRIAERLMLDPQERSELLALFPVKRRYNKDGTDTVPMPTYLQLSSAQFRVIGEWQHFAIIALMRTDVFNSDPIWIAHKLGLSVTKVEQSLARLISIGAIEKIETGELKSLPQNVRTTDDIADVSLRRSHDETLDLAKESLHREEISQRDFTHITVAIDPKNLSMAKELIRKFQDEFTNLVETGTKTEVYRLSMQLFPLSKTEEGKIK